MEQTDFTPDPKTIVDGGDREGVETWVLDTDTLEVYIVTDPDGDEDTMFEADNMFELLGMIRYAHHTGMLSPYAVAHFTRRLVTEIE